MVELPQALYSKTITEDVSTFWFLADYDQVISVRDQCTFFLFYIIFFIIIILFMIHGTTEVFPFGITGITIFFLGSLLYCFTYS